MKPIRVLVAEHHHLVRAGIQALLRTMDGIEVVAEATDARQAVRLIKRHRPQVALMDIEMQGMNRLEAAARVARKFPQIRVIALSMNFDAKHVRQAHRVGLAGYLVKNSPDELEVAIRTVASDKRYFSRDVLQPTRESEWGGKAVAGPRAHLPMRQHQLLKMIAEGNSTKQIAHKLNISLKTAETHRTRLMERLDIHDIAGLVRYAIRVGLVTPDK